MVPASVHFPWLVWVFHRRRRVWINLRRFVLMLWDTSTHVLIWLHFFSHRGLIKLPSEYKHLILPFFFPLISSTLLLRTCCILLCHFFRQGRLLLLNWELIKLTFFLGLTPSTHHVTNGSEFFILSELSYCLSQFLDINAFNVVRIQTQKLQQVLMGLHTSLEAWALQLLKEIICVDEIDFFLLDLRFHHLRVNRVLEEVIDALSFLHQVLCESSQILHTLVI